ncbi:ABC transporter substrate-binding protein [Paraglaciecola sp. L3A3]|uniref:substrate-binding periplasmic protein n=1 Tax=Paraglaciecola sp. L3A3 TaxID=2686358 RepID=UPI00131D1927|nr:transporter substrate-binding domain-containing protein [Paraglaciecola sp. L3A3]
MKKKVQILLLFLFYALPIGVTAETLISYCRNYSPELFFKNGRCSGAVPDLATDIFAKLGHDIVWIQQPPLGRSVREAKQGKVDLLIMHSMTPERQIFLHPVEYASPTRVLFFYKSPKFTSDIDSYEALKKVTLGAIRNVFYSPSFSKLDSHRLVLVDKTEQLLAMLELGRIDVAVTSAYHYIELFDGRFNKVSLKDSFINPMYISISKRSKAAKYYAKVSAIMLDYRKSGKVDKYFKKYGMPAPPQIFEKTLKAIDGKSQR